MDIQQYIALDKKLLLNLNGSNSLFWDGFMWVATSTYIWIPTAIILLYIIIKNNTRNFTEYCNDCPCHYFSRSNCFRCL